jgi:hypothetical protein
VRPPFEKGANELRCDFPEIALRPADLESRKIVVGMLALLCALAAPQAARAAEPPNLVFILADDKCDSTPR